MSDTTTALTAGTVVNARPWVAGAERAFTSGIVLAPFGEEYALVWFPGMNDGEIVTGQSVQPIMLVKIERTGNARPLSALPVAWIRNAYRLARAANRAGAWKWFGAGAVIQTAARATR